jgi:hypothetical protein
MAVFEQLPGDLSLALVRGDEFPFSATFNANLTGYTLQASIYNDATGAEITAPTMTMTTATVNGVTTSTVAFLLTETQTTSLTASRMRWFFRWVSPAPSSVTRTVLAGTVKAIKA